MKDTNGRECTKCGEWKPFEQYHKNRKGFMGRHSHCRDCHNQNKRERRLRIPETYEQKRVQSLKSRYGLTLKDFDDLFASQDGKCAICREVPARPCVDHNHTTGKVRGILCHYCNIRLPAVEDEKYLAPAKTYLARHAANDNNPSEADHASSQ